MPQRVERITELDVLVLDCQATGASPRHGFVLELSWGVSTRDGLEAEQAHWIALPPGAVVPRQVRRLTGFDESTQVGALLPEEAWMRLQQSVSPRRPMPAAIHFARFELAFLRDWSRRFEPNAEFPLDAVCVHAIAQRLYPELPRRTLRALAGYLGFTLALERRSLGHVEATAFIWRKLCEELERRGITRFEDVKGFIAEKAPSSPRGTRRAYPLPQERYRALPDSPGVYQFLRSNGDVLYVGKAQSLKKRVSSHFSARSTREHSIEMLTQVSDVRVTLTDSALEAGLLENETIKALRPMYNVQLMNPEGASAWFSDPCFEAVQASPDATHCVGPLPSPFALRPLGALLRRLSFGVDPARRERAWAVGVAEPFAPDEAVFELGFSEFLRRHFAERAASRAALFRTAKALILAKLPAKSPEDVDDPPERPSEAWDAERVLRNLERALVQSYRLLRRAHWLCLLSESSVVFREPEGARARILLIRDAELRDARALDSAEVPVPTGDPGTPLARRKATFDRTRYDRLRILTTELKRIQKEGGEVSVHLSRAHVVSGQQLSQMLVWV